MAGKIIIDDRTGESVIIQADPGSDIQAVPLIITPERNYDKYMIYIGTHAESIYTFSGLPLNTETVTIDGKVYTFQTVLTNVDGNVLIGANAEATIDNLVAAITLALGGGTTYAALTVVHPTFTAVKRSASTMAAIVQIYGASTLATTEAATNVTVDGVTVDAIADALIITFALSPDAINYVDHSTITAIADADSVMRKINTESFNTIRLTGDSPTRVTIIVHGNV